MDSHDSKSGMTPAPAPDDEAATAVPKLPPEVEAAWDAFSHAITEGRRVAFEDVREYECIVGDTPWQLRQAIATALAAARAREGAAVRAVRSLRDEFWKATGRPAESGAEVIDG